MSNEFSQLLRTAREWTGHFLEGSLPTIGGEDWWEKCVRWKLSVPQEHALEERGIKDLSGLDLGALLRVVEKNWRELCLHRRLPREGRTLVNEVRNVRNRLAHEPLSNIPLEDQQRDADTIAQFLELIGADSGAVQSARVLKESLMRRGGAGETSSSDEAVAEAGGAADDLGTEGETVLVCAETQGVPMASLGARAAAVQGIGEALQRATFVGIDFGTSTTVVSVVTTDGEQERLVAEPISVTQPDESGREISDYLVPSCIAWTRDRLLVGRGAAGLRAELVEGRNIWSSFKMRLGIDLGPQYPNTALAGGKGPVVIERPQDAARVFFEHIREAVEDFVQSRGLPPRIYYSVSVPAAFEANQRQDLLNALAEAGIPVEESGLIDEPNAAFLSYLVEMERNADGSRFIDTLADKPRRVLVFDFGAGTCDISVLEVKVEQERLSSRNLAISKFMALGGDDIDRAVARAVLLPQLCGAQRPSDLFTQAELEQVVLPRLKPEAERLKIQCSKLAEGRGLRTPDGLRGQSDVVRGKPIPPIVLRGGKLALKDPRISLGEFADILEPFLLGPTCVSEEMCGAAPSVIEPVASALDKAGLECDDLDMVLFIGGSCENPLVRRRIEDHVGRFVDCVTPRDLRSHVSQGAAVHSLFVHGLGWELIRPITSEPIFVVTRNGNLEQLLPAGTSVPSPDIAVTDLRIGQERQQLVELPICVSGRDKVLAVVSIPAPNPPGYFKEGETVRLSCSITREKLLKVRVRIGNRALTARILNPLANAEVAPKDRRYLEARQALNESILAGGGRPTANAVLTFARAAEKAKRWREAAEMFEAVERLDPSRDFATSMAYSYERAGDRRRSDSWSETAHERSPNSITAYNLALARHRKGDMAGYERLMEESLERDPDENATLHAYGHHLMDKGDPRGTEYLEKACALFYAQLKAEVLSEDDAGRLYRAASTLGKRKVLAELRAYRKKKGVGDEVIREEFLAAGAETDALRTVG